MHVLSCPLFEAQLIRKASMDDAEYRQKMATAPRPDFSVRLATIEDADGVTATLEAAFPVLTEKHYDPEVLRRCLPLICRANPSLLQSGTYFVATNIEGTVIGCGGWSSERPGDGMNAPGVAHIRHFATHADWIGRGVGRAIHSCAELQARERGFSVFETYASLNAVGFYRSLRFAEIGTISFRLAAGAEYPSVHMSRAI